MSTEIRSSQSIRQLAPVELAMMRDMMWSIVPEPGSFVLTVTGCGILIAARRNRSK